MQHIGQADACQRKRSADCKTEQFASLAFSAFFFWLSPNFRVHFWTGAGFVAGGGAFVRERERWTVTEEFAERFAWHVEQSAKQRADGEHDQRDDHQWWFVVVMAVIIMMAGIVRMRIGTVVIMRTVAVSIRGFGWNH